MMIEDRLGHELREQWLAEEESARKQRRLERYMARRQREVKRLVLQRRAKEEEERKQRARQARERARAGRGQEDGRVGALSYASDEGATAEEWYGSVDDEVAKDHPGEGLRSPRSPDPEAGTGEEGWTDQDAGLWTGEDTPRSDYGGSQEPGTPTHPRAVSDSGRSGRSVEDGETEDGAHHLGEDASDDEGAGSRDGALQEKDSGDEASRIDDIEGEEGGDGDDGASSDASVEEGEGVAGSNSRSGAGAGNEAAEGEVVAGPDGKDEAWQVSTEAELPSLEGEETGGDVGEVGPPSSSTSPRPAGAPKEDLSGGPSPPPSL